MQFLGIQVVQPRLQDVLTYSFLARAGEGAGGGLPPRQAGRHTDVADRDDHRIHDIHLITIGIQSVLAGAEHPPPDTFLAGFGQKLAGG